MPSVSVHMVGLPDLGANVAGFDGKTGDYAGKVETSLLSAPEPDCVDPGLLPEAGEEEHPFGMGLDAGEADQSIGRRMVADEVRWLGAKAEELEDIWVEEVEPEIPNFASMRPGSGTMSSSSLWALNHAISWQPPRR